jgi:HD-like signal output (HDOD) protein
MSQTSVIFVDDDASILSSMRRMLHPLRKEWNMRFAVSGAEALEMMSKEKFDVIVSDMRMPEMNGAQLLARAKSLYPGMARLILSGHAERELAVQTISVTHQFLNKPCSVEELGETINQSISLRHMLQKPELCEMANSIVQLPSKPASYAAIMEELGNDKPSIEKVTEIVENDPAMTVTMLRLVNSGFFGLGSRVGSVMEAIGLLGLELVKSLALSGVVFSKYDGQGTFSIEQFADRGINVANLARQLASLKSISKNMIDEVFVAGMLCDIGLLAMHSLMREKYQGIVDYAQGEHIPILEAEKKVLGATHAELGAYLMALWGFDDHVIEAIAYHHHPEKAMPNQQPMPLDFVHIADSLIPSIADNPETSTLNTDFLASKGLSDHLSEWQKFADILIGNANDA